MALIWCRFNDYNNGNIQVNVRLDGNKSAPIAGVLRASAIPDKQFQIDTSYYKDGGWYRLITRPMYNITTSTGWVQLNQLWLKSPDVANLNKTSSAEKEKKESANKVNTSNKQTETTTSLTSSNTLNYSTGLDEAIYDMLQKSFDLGEYTNNTRIMGTPFKFLKSADYRPFSGYQLGRQYLENILAEAPIVHLVPGLPTYMPGIDSDEQEAIDNFIKARYNNNDIDNIVSEKILNEDLRYFEFTSAYSEYIKYVNLLCRISAIYIGIGDKNVPGTSTKYKNYDWGAWTNINYTKTTPVKNSVWDYVWGTIESAGEAVTDALFGDYKYVKCYVEPNASFNESVSNDTGQSQIASLFDTYEQIIKEVGFLSNGGKITSGVVDFSTGALASIASLIPDTFGEGSGISKLLGSAENVLTGSNAIFPKLWQDSNTGKSYSFTVNLVSPYGDPESIYLNIIMPMMHFVAMSYPRQTSANSFASPFLVKMFAKGITSCDLGIISSISIEKGGDGTAWTVTGLPLEAKISITIDDLYSNLMVTSTKQPTLFFKNQGLIDYLSVTCGVDLTRTNFAMKLASLISTYKDSLFDIPSNTYDDVINGIRNSIEPMFKLGW